MCAAVSASRALVMSSKRKALGFAVYSTSDRDALTLSPLRRAGGSSIALLQAIDVSVSEHALRAATYRSSSYSP